MEKTPQLFIRVATPLNWNIYKQTTKGETIMGFFYALPDAAKAIGRNIDKEYSESLELFKELVISEIVLEKSGEYSLMQSRNNVYYHRNKNRLVAKLFEHILKKICIDKNVDYMEALKICSVFYKNSKVKESEHDENIS